LALEFQKQKGVAIRITGGKKKVNSLHQHPLEGLVIGVERNAHACIVARRNVGRVDGAVSIYAVYMLSVSMEVPMARQQARFTLSVSIKC
jgi:hypothetical protein